MCCSTSTNPTVRGKQAISHRLLPYCVTSPSSNPQEKVNGGRGRGAQFSALPGCHSLDFERSLAPVCAHVTIMIRIDDRDILISLSSKKGDRGRNLLIWSVRLILTSKMVWKKVISLLREAHGKELLLFWTRPELGAAKRSSPGSGNHRFEGKL